MKPEEQTEIILWDWLITKGKDSIKEIYFNRENQLNCKTFTTSGVNKKPDFIIKINRGYGFEYIALEIKNSSSSRNIHDSGKILNYYKNYFLGLTKYFIENKEIIINHFAVASENSINGHLFLDDENVISNEDSNDSWRKTNSMLGLEPKFEYRRTSDFLRRLWSEWRGICEDCSKQKKWTGIKAPSIGILISNPTIDKNPYLFTMVYSNWNKSKKPKWGARFWKL